MALPNVIPDHLFRINADNTIVDMARGGTISLALPSYAFDGIAMDAEFAEKFWDTVHHVRRTGTPGCIERRSCTPGHVRLFEIRLTPTLTGALIGIVCPVMENTHAADTLREGDTATRPVNFDLWTEKHRRQADSGMNDDRTV